VLQLILVALLLALLPVLLLPVALALSVCCVGEYSCDMTHVAIVVKM
jgi:hypothetical protein